MYVHVQLRMAPRSVHLIVVEMTMSELYKLIVNIFTSGFVRKMIAFTYHFVTKLKLL